MKLAPVAIALAALAGALLLLATTPSRVMIAAGPATGAI